MLATIFIGLVCVAIGIAVGFGRSWIAGFRQGGYDEAKADEARRDLEMARKQGEVLSTMRAASEQDESNDDPFRER